MTEIGTQTEDTSTASSYIIVCGGEDEKSDAVELPLDKDGTLAISTLQLEFTTAAGLKYKNPDTGLMRFLKPDNGFIPSPPEGWGTIKYIACIAKTLPVKRPVPLTAASTSNGPLAKVAKVGNAANTVPVTKPAPPGTRQLVQKPSVSTAPATRPNNPVLSNPTGAVYTNSPAVRSANGSTEPAAGSSGGSNIQSSCNICNVTMNSLSQMQHHYEGKRHKDMVMMAQRGRGALARGGLPLTRPPIMRGMPVARGLGPRMPVRRPMGGLPMNRGGGRPMGPMRGRGLAPGMSPQMRPAFRPTHHHPPAFRQAPPAHAASFANDDWAFSGFNDFSGPQPW